MEHLRWHALSCLSSVLVEAAMSRYNCRQLKKSADQKGSQKNCQCHNAVSDFILLKTAFCQLYNDWPIVVAKQNIIHRLRPPLLGNPAVLNADNTVGKLGDLIIMGNHHQRLTEFIAGNF